MKKCKSCGALQKDERTVCIDCGQRLGKPLTDSEAEALEEGLDNKLEEMCDATDDLRVTKTDKVLILLHILSTAALIVSAIINPGGHEDIRDPLIWCFVLNAISVVELAIPSALWNLHILGLGARYGNADELEPGWGWKASRKIISIITLIFTDYIVFMLLR
ncbi:MAG: hypothetical protein J6L96_07350 [Clostridia bacterium]|nr:hypothetical protein [Clostridia bacterium]